MDDEPRFAQRVRELSGVRLLCHCRARQRCHADSGSQVHTIAPPSAEFRLQQNLFSRSREEKSLLNHQEEHCDRQGLPSPGRWESQFGKYPADDRLAWISRIFIRTAEAPSFGRTAVSIGPRSLGKLPALGGVGQPGRKVLSRTNLKEEAFR